MQGDDAHGTAGLRRGYRHSQQGEVPSHRDAVYKFTQCLVEGQWLPWWAKNLEYHDKLGAAWSLIRWPRKGRYCRSNNLCIDIHIILSLSLSNNLCIHLHTRVFVRATYALSACYDLAHLTDVVWSCTVCTLLNSPDVNECEACQTKCI